MKRLIAALGVGWGLIYATNHLLLPRAPTESKVAVQSEQTSTNRSINSWGPYLSDVKPEPNNMAQTSLKSRQTQEPAASEAELMPSSSRDIIDHAEAVALEERTLRVARVENPPTSAVRQHDGSPSSLQDLKPNSEAVALEERTLRVARVENPPTSAVRQDDGSPSSLQDLKPNSEAVALEERILRVARVENPPTAAEREHDGMQSSAQDINPNSEAVASEERTLQVARVENPLTAAEREHEGMQSSPQDIKPNSEAVTSAERSLQAGSRPAGSASIARVENPPTPSRKPRSPVAPKARIAQATADQDLPWRVGSASHRRGVGLFIFAPPGF
jgi:hypothetical protein